MNDYNFGNFVCKLREEKGLTQAHIASHLGVSVAAVSKWENGSSKPRVDVLFRLAEILDVTPEELMAGHRIEGDGLDPEAIRELNARYEYLGRVEYCNETGTKIRRIIAWLIDWNIVGLIDILLLGVTAAFFPDSADSTVPTVIMLIVMLLYPILFTLRDVIPGGRSIGKRICGLVVLNKKTGDEASRVQLIVRGLLFFFIIQVDGILMIASGRSVGDHLANTVVVAKKDIEGISAIHTAEGLTSAINHYHEARAESARKNKRTMIILVCSIIAAIALLFGSIFAITLGVLNQATKTDEYRMAYSYLIESGELERLGVDADRIRLNSLNTVSTVEDGVRIEKRTYGFSIGGLHEIYVVCHNDGDGWYVCEECTGF